MHTNGFDIGSLLPVLFHTSGDAGRFITAGVVIVRDPDTERVKQMLKKIIETIRVEYVA